jgi:hypothetical protein
MTLAIINHSSTMEKTTVSVAPATLGRSLEKDYSKE